MIYFESDCPSAMLAGARTRTVYDAKWFNPRTGAWSSADGGTAVAEADGTIQLPAFPSGKQRSTTDWELKLILRFGK